MALLKKRTFWYALIGLGFLSLLLVTSDLNALVEVIGTLRPTTVLTLIALQFLTIFLISLQWFLLARHMRMPLSFGLIYEMNMVGTFFESVTPAVKTGGEAYKLYYLKQKGRSVPQGGALLSAQKLFSMAAFILLASLSILYFVLTQSATSATLRTIAPIYGGFLALIAGVVVMVLGANRFLSSERFPGLKKRTAGFKSALHETLAPLKSRKGMLFLYGVLSLSIWALYAFKTFYVLGRFGINLDYLSSAFPTFLAYMAGMVPFTPGGLGTFEGAFTVAMQPYGIPTAKALAAVLTLRLFTYWFQLLFSAVYLTSLHGVRRWFHAPTD